MLWRRRCIILKIEPKFKNSYSDIYATSLGDEYFVFVSIQNYVTEETAHIILLLQTQILTS